MFNLELSTSRERYLAKLCYGVGQGAKLAETEIPYKVGQHTEAMRLTILWLIRQHPEDFQADLIAALAEAGIDVDLNPSEGGKP